MHYSVTIYGRSDDLIEVEGDIRAEFCDCSDKVKQLNFSDGSAIVLRYMPNGCWDIHVKYCGRGTTFSMQSHDNDVTSYTDVLTLRRDSPFTACHFSTYED
jgi:hypothetical protein